jgi:hypothetical protein
MDIHRSECSSGRGLFFHHQGARKMNRTLPILLRAIAAVH